MNTRTWMAVYSASSRMEENRPEPLSYRPETAVIERWTGTAWIEVLLKWDGEKYVEVK